MKGQLKKPYYKYQNNEKGGEPAAREKTVYKVDPRNTSRLIKIDYFTFQVDMSNIESMLDHQMDRFRDRDEKKNNLKTNLPLIL